MSVVAVSVLSVAGAMGDAAGTGLDTQVLCGLSLPLCGLVQPLHGLLYPLYGVSYLLCELL